MRTPSSIDEKLADLGTAYSSRGQFPYTLEEVATLTNFIYAHHCATVGKKHRARVFRYADDLGENLLKLQQAVLAGTYKPKPCSDFEIFCTAGQKIRKISAPAFEDTVVQHVLYQSTYTHFDKKFIFDSYGCRRGKGTHKASDRLQYFMRRAPAGSYILQIDVRKYYYSIDHSILRESLARSVADPALVDLMMKFCGDGEVGLNVGCLLSQLYGMIYLDRFDHWVKRTLKIGMYIRYVDDMIMILPNRQAAEDVLAQCVAYLRDNLRLELSKHRIVPLSEGANFVGFRTKAGRRVLRRRSVVNFKRAVRKAKIESIASILGHALGTASYRPFLHTALNTLQVEDIRRLPDRFRDDMAELIACCP